MPTEHQCWLIETTATPTPLYFAGWTARLDAFKLSRKTAESFVQDANGAIRFPTKDSAEHMLCALLGQSRTELSGIFRMHLSCYRVAEHIFDYTPTSAGSSGVPGNQQEGGNV